MDHPDYVAGDFTTAFMDSFEMSEIEEEE